MKKRIFTLLLFSILLIQMSQLVSATESSFVWSFQPGLSGIVINDPRGSVTIDHSTGLPLHALTIDEIMTTGKTDYSDDEISFNLKVTPKTEDMNNFLALFTFRNNSPGDPVWAPGVNAITLEVYKEKITLTGKRNGNAINETVTMGINLTDGNVHNFKISIDDDKKEVTVKINDNEEVSLIFSRISSSGGYQIYGQKATVEMTEFKASDSRAVATSTPSPSPTTAPTPTQSADPTTPPESSTPQSSETQSEPDATPTQGADSEDSSVSETEESNQTSSEEISEESSDSISSSEESTSEDDEDDSGASPVLIIVLGSIVILGGAAAAAYFLILKKK